MFSGTVSRKTSHLCPLPVAAGHVNSSNVLEELVGRNEVRQACEELSHVDEVHAGQDILVEAKQSQSRAEQELFTISAEHIPHSTRQVQRQRLAIQSEDPEGTNMGRKSYYQLALYKTKSLIATEI